MANPIQSYEYFKFAELQSFQMNDISALLAIQLTMAEQIIYCNNFQKVIDDIDSSCARD